MYLNDYWVVFVLLKGPSFVVHGQSGGLVICRQSVQCKFLGIHYKVAHKVHFELNNPYYILHERSY